ncbi:hypothetical protein SNOG_02590 [Parastagonospora nodorum SN15]|uniref:Uncharacterized protein n=1 Tax=Phaeosphaeria nodorum (strain SN15 / ATCC MYA-4574 / FGSC 10173) TaxID=321614 RepID=Q0V074_PHANO|nr:hypothetical protein SNOG_02590 [Parastagonospora nodorum SN15]EAT89321.1 hypothetical protein SNOG_02590 [Parastagonospora nodorum SN15]
MPAALACLTVLQNYDGPNETLGLHPILVLPVIVILATLSQQRHNSRYSAEKLSPTIQILS